MALKAAIARKKAEAEAKAEATTATPPVATPPATAAAPPASDTARKTASAPPTAPVGAFEVKRGFLNASKGALYPEGSSEARPAGWRGSSSGRPVFALMTHDDRCARPPCWAVAPTDDASLCRQPPRMCGMHRRRAHSPAASWCFRYEVVGNFAEAGDYLGKEDFAVSRVGFSLKIRGNPNADPRSLVYGLCEKARRCPGAFLCVTHWRPQTTPL